MKRRPSPQRHTVQVHSGPEELPLNFVTRTFMHLSSLLLQPYELSVATMSCAPPFCLSLILAFLQQCRCYLNFKNHIWN